MRSPNPVPDTKSMAEEPWNRVNIPFPGAVSSVRIHFTSKTDVLVKNVLLESENVLKLVDNEILQTEIRVLYELLYILNNSYRGNKSFKGIQQVEQCVNRLKSMKLVDALQELSDLCPKRIQRNVGKKSGECNVPSQPMLEWLCLKILGAANLMNHTLQRCSRAFLLCNQQMKWGEFLVLNMVFTSMLARMWVIFRGVLLSLSTLYEKMLCLCSEVAKARPMPSLKGFSLPPNMSELLDPAVLHDQTCQVNVEKQKNGPRTRESSNPRQKQRPAKKVREDLGVSIKRDINDNSDLKPYINIFKTFSKVRFFFILPQGNGVASKMRSVKNNVTKSTSFGDIHVHLKEMVQWCKLKKMVKKRRLFNYLLLRCQKIKSLESNGNNVQGKLTNFRREVVKACSKGSVPRRTPGSLAAFRTKNKQTTNFHSLRSEWKSTVRTGSKRKREVKERKCRKSKSRRHHKDADRRTEDEAIPQSSHCDRQDDIDDIFASIGL
ncbi:nucleolus and neural progenitor protein [Eucyclogobius newberryi]|uniref:nucleolus and neural progenitor protein n=1 Tax=Eucyclogobius newberryi TaxID=166745 RepID=UPI003B5BF53C